MKKFATVSMLSLSMSIATFAQRGANKMMGFDGGASSHVEGGRHEGPSRVHDVTTREGPSKAPTKPDTKPPARAESKLSVAPAARAQSKASSTPPTAASKVDLKSRVDKNRVPNLTEASPNANKDTKLGPLTVNDKGVGAGGGFTVGIGPSAIQNTPGSPSGAPMIKVSKETK